MESPVSGDADSSSDGSASGSSSSSSSGSDSRSGSASGSGSASSGGEDRLESATILGNDFKLPQELCEKSAVFEEFFSMRTFASLSEAGARHLRTFLPNFPEDDECQKDITLRKLFNREEFKFGSPLVEFQRRLREGAYRPDLARARRRLQKARRHHAKHQWRSQWRRTLQSAVTARTRLLTLAARAPPGAPLPRSVPEPAPLPSAHLKAKRRYFQELSVIHSEVCGDNGALSSDDNFKDSEVAPRGGSKREGGSVPAFSEEWKRRALRAHKRRKLHEPDHPELVTAGITLRSIRERVGRVAAGSVSAPVAASASRARRPPRRAPQRPPLSPPVRPPSPDSEGEGAPLTPPPPPPPQPPPLPTPQLLKEKSPPTAPQETVQEEAVACPGVELVQATHACFLSVLRELVCLTPRHCLPLPALAASLRRWRQSPIAPLNHWYSGVEDWLKALPSAVAFLAGESEACPDDFVPYLQYKPVTQVYQWIGAGRDSDALLLPLCARWLNHRPSSTTTPQPEAAPLTAETHKSQLHATQWSSGRAAPSSTADLESFRAQERLRFQQPHRAFTYRLRSGDATVGPLKGAHAHDEPGSGRGARGHSLLAAARPRHVTLLALVRDAVACLPGGEGTRAHITQLLRRSQYLVSGAGEQALQAAVSGALDRMHCTPDPCVRYLPARKLWMYLHKDRTEEEFERLHAETQSQSRGKGGAAGGGGNSRRARARVPAPRAPSEGDEDAPVDVEGPEETPDLTRPYSPNKPAQQPTYTSILQEHPKSEISSSLTPVTVSAPISAPPPQVSVPATCIAPQPPPQPQLQTQPLQQSTQLQLQQPIQKVVMQQPLQQPKEVPAPPVSSVSTPLRSVVRVLGTASGKSLISPRALQAQPQTQIITQAQAQTQIQTQAQPQTQMSTHKVLVQRAAPASGALSPAHQRILLESLMQHQRTHGQHMSRDQLLHTIHSTQKMSSSPGATPAATSTVETVNVSSSGSTSSSTTPTQLQLTSGQAVQLASGQTMQLASGQTVQLAGQTVQLGGQTVQLGGQKIQTVQFGGQKLQTLQLSGQTLQLAGQTVQLGGQTVQLGGQTVQLGGQTVQLGGQTVQLGQTVQVARQTVQLANQRHPLVAKILTNAQVRGAGRLGLSLAQLQGKPVLLHAPDLLLTSNRESQQPQQHQHLLLGGNVVRVSQGGGVLRPGLRLQAPTAPSGPAGASPAPMQVQLQMQQQPNKSAPLKLQATPLRLHQGQIGAGRMLLAGGSQLKLLPVSRALVTSVAQQSPRPQVPDNANKK